MEIYEELGLLPLAGFLDSHSIDSCCSSFSVILGIFFFAMLPPFEEQSCLLTGLEISFGEQPVRDQTWKNEVYLKYKTQKVASLQGKPGAVCDKACTGKLTGDYSHVKLLGK